MRKAALTLNLADISAHFCPAAKALLKDAEKTSKMFDILLGDNMLGRKEYIIENGHLYIDAADVS